MSGTILVFSHTRFFPEHLIFPAENGENFFPETDHFIIQSTRIIASGTGRKREGFSGKNPFLQSRLGKEQNFPPDSPQQGRGGRCIPPCRHGEQRERMPDFLPSPSPLPVPAFSLSALLLSSHLSFPVIFFSRKSPPREKGKKRLPFSFPRFSRSIPLSSLSSQGVSHFPSLLPPGNWAECSLWRIKIRLFIDTLLISLLRKETLLSI